MPTLVPAPEDAIAVSLCLLNREFPNSESHPIEGCRFCEKPTSDLLEALKYFDIVAESRGTSWCADHVKAFRALPETEQKRLVREAQAIHEGVPA